MDDDLVLIKTGDVVDSLAGVARSAGQDQSLGAVERGGQADLAVLGGVSLYIKACLVSENWPLNDSLGSAIYIKKRIYLHP